MHTSRQKIAGVSQQTLNPPTPSMAAKQYPADCVGFHLDITDTFEKADAG
jgi:hypothetical protein